MTFKTAWYRLGDCVVLASTVQVMCLWFISQGCLTWVPWKLNICVVQLRPTFLGHQRTFSSGSYIFRRAWFMAWCLGNDDWAWDILGAARHVWAMALHPAPHIKKALCHTLVCFGCYTSTGILVRMLDCSRKVSDLKLQSHYWVHFQTSTLWKGMKPLIPSSYSPV